MNEKVFDYLKEYIDHMLPEAKKQLMDMPVYQEYQSEKQRLSDLIAFLLAQNKPLTDSTLIADARKLESLGNQVLEAAKRLDPYGD